MWLAGTWSRTNATVSAGAKEPLKGHHNDRPADLIRVTGNVANQ
jgi:hypothetical protein